MLLVQKSSFIIILDTYKPGHLECAFLLTQFFVTLPVNVIWWHCLHVWFICHVSHTHSTWHYMTWYDITDSIASHISPHPISHHITSHRTARCITHHISYHMWHATPHHIIWWRHQMEHFPRYWPFVWGIHQSPVNSPHKGQWRGALMLSLICAWINDWVNNRGAGDLKCPRIHYDVIVMWYTTPQHVFENSMTSIKAIAWHWTNHKPLLEPMRN